MRYPVATDRPTRDPTIDLRGETWREIDLDAAKWRIPGERIKRRDDHIVPLSTQAVATLRELQAVTGRRNFVFPSVRSPDRPMSEKTVTGALRRLGYSGKKMPPIASRRWRPVDQIELRLANAERKKVLAAYNCAHLTERRKMMQAWTDLKEGGGAVTAFREMA